MTQRGVEENKVPVRPKPVLSNKSHNTSRVDKENISVNVSINNVSLAKADKPKEANKPPKPARISIMSLERIRYETEKRAAQAKNTSLMKNTLEPLTLQRKMKTKPLDTSRTRSHPYAKPQPQPTKASAPIKDDNWMEKQERGFVKWLNFVFSPFYEEDLVGSAAVMDTDAPLTYRDIANRRRDTVLRSDGQRLLSSGNHRQVLKVVEKVMTNGVVSTHN